MTIQQQQEELMKKKVEEFIARGGKITKIKYHGPKKKDTQIIGVKKKKKVKGLTK